MSDRLRVRYQVPPDTPDVGAFAAIIAREQTVELPPATYPDRIERDVVGRVELLDPAPDGRPQFAISYDPAIVGNDLLQLVNVVYGNVSLLPGVRVADVALPATMVARIGGPRVGLGGLRSLTGVASRPLLVGAVKPIGLTSEELAERGAALARGGMDVIKDDHGLTDQDFAPFRERVAQCQDAIQEAGTRAGGETAHYAPNVTGPLETLPERLEHVRACGCRIVVMSPMLTGLGALRMAGAHELAVLTHPAMTGGLVCGDAGLDASVFLGVLQRLAGADGVVFIAAGGRFPVTVDETERIVRRVRSADEGMAPALPVLGGGIAAEDAGAWVERLGIDQAFLVGSSLYATGDLEGAARRLRDAVERACA
jgi:ribulose-bisphosphate carboxylase large chain